MNKKGFTLVELLAVIAILAILVVMAVPNVISLFNGAKVSTFISQVESLYKSVEQQVVANQMRGSTSSTYTFCYSTNASDTKTNKLSLSGNDKLYYYITYTNGKITSFYAQDASFGVEISNSSGIGLSDFSAATSGKYTYIGTATSTGISGCSSAPSGIKTADSVAVE